MIFKYSKQLLLALSVFSMSCAYGMPTHKEVMDELAQLRKENPRLQEEFTPVVQSLLHEVDEARVLDETKGSWDYWTKYATFTLTTPIFRDYITLLTKENAPKTYEFVATIAQKVGFTELPLIYLVNNEKFFNAFATGYLHSMSLIALGEKLVKETADSQALEFIVAHELAHVKNRHLPKQLALGTVSAAAVVGAYAYRLIKPDTDSLLAFYATVATTTLLKSWYSRVHERDADMTAGHAVGAKGGVEFFNLLKEKTASRLDKDYAILKQEIEKTSLKNDNHFAFRVALSKGISHLGEGIENFFSKVFSPLDTHPSHQERIDYLTELLKQQEAQAPQPAMPASYVEVEAAAS